VRGDGPTGGLEAIDELLELPLLDVLVFLVACHFALSSVTAAADQSQLCPNERHANQTAADANP
jgi:hypothetical protein